MTTTAATETEVAQLEETTLGNNGTLRQLGLYSLVIIYSSDVFGYLRLVKNTN